MADPTTTFERIPTKAPPAFSPATPAPFVSPRGFDLAAFQSAVGNLAMQRAAQAPDQFTTAEGDKLPAPVIVDWGERFEISFGTRTTSYGDVRFRIRFRYLGAQTPEHAQDQDQTMELYPAPENPKVGEPQDRRLNARIISHDSATIVVDAYGDGKVVYAIEDELLPKKPNGARDHHIVFYRNLDPGVHASFTMTFTSSGGKPVPEVGQGTMVPAVPAVTKPAFEPDPERTPDLSTNMLMQMALGRLAGLKIKPVSLFLWDVRLRADLPTNVSIVGEPKLRLRLRRLLDLLAYVGPVFTTLEAMSKKEQYLGGLADVATARVFDIVKLYGDAILASYYSEATTNEPLAAADKALAEFPGWLNTLYLRDSRGVISLIAKIPELQAELRGAQLLHGESYYYGQWKERSSQVTKMGVPGWGPGTLYRTREQQRENVEWAWRGEKDYVSEQIHELYADVQTDIGMLTAMILREQCSYLAHQLSSSLINDVMEVFAADREDKAQWYATQLWHIVNEFETNSYETDGKAKQATAQAILERLKSLVGEATTFESDVDAFNSRLKWINRIDFVGKLALIVAAAALTGGVAGSLAAELGAGSLLTAVATGFGFTVASRLGQQLAFGKVEGSFVGDWFWNTVTLGVLKAASAGLAGIIKLPAGAGMITKMGVGLGRAGGAMIALHGVAEIQTLLTKQRLMTWDERGEALFTNAVLMVALHAGKFITDPIEGRLTKGVVAKLRLNDRIAKRMDQVAAQREPIRKRIDEISNGDTPPPAEVDRLVADIEATWAEELKFVDQAENSKLISEGELDTALAAHREHIARMQLRLSQIGVEAPSPGGTTFRPIEPGVVAFTPEGRPSLEAFYDPADASMSGKSLIESATMPGVLEGRLPTGEVTYYVPEGSTGPVDVIPGAPAPTVEPGRPTAPAERKTGASDPGRDVLLKEAEQRIADAEESFRNAQEHENEAAENAKNAKTDLEFYEAEAKRDAATARRKRSEARRFEAEVAARRRNPKRGDPAEAEKQAADANREADRLEKKAEEARSLVEQARERSRESREQARTAKKDVPVAEKRATQARESHERQTDLSRRLDELEARYRNHPEVRAKPNVEPPTGSAAGKLKWEIDSVKRQLRGEVAKAGMDVYDRLRAASPGRDATKLALQNLESLPASLLGPNKHPIDVTTGLEMNPADISPDHIYPLKSIAGEKGINKLTPRQQLDIAELIKNYMPLSEKANFSKSGRTMEEWFETDVGSKVPVNLREVLIEIQAKAREHVQQEIKNMIKQNESHSE
jgi:hypothetical protein